MYNRVWFFVFQQPVVIFVVFLATEITEAAKVYCATSSKVVFAHNWLSSFELTTSMCAIVAVVRFHKGAKTMTVKQRTLLKLLTFKVIVFLWTTQNAIFNYLTSSGEIHANDYLFFLDFTVGLQSLIVCAEMVVVSILFQFAYPVSPYLWKHQAANPAGRSGRNTDYSGGFLGVKAILGAANISDLPKGIVAAPAKFARGRAMKRTEAESGNSVPLGERQKTSVPTFEIAPGE
ncbi:hypothetical protein JMJ35_010381 [Cladonia borealis]|uniref:Transmembrane protein n=1 Tax=Cladonia borealis TaxID=184061 RepID=A0AA39UXA4_9LECA|nr:hypothetical protein JMJ35_010381 [Cladonia borealis]